MIQLDLFSWRPRRRRPAKAKGAHEWKIVSVRETAPETLPLCDVPQQAVDYWRAHIATAPHFNPDVECLAVLLLNVKMRVRGHHLVSIGSLNEAMAHPREVFRAAVIAAAYAVMVMHNHPSGDPTPSSADQQITKVLADAGRILRINVTDHIIVGHDRHCSFRETGLL
jgi:DNA repair protein RadC